MMMMMISVVVVLLGLQQKWIKNHKYYKKVLY